MHKNFISFHKGKRISALGVVLLSTLLLILFASCTEVIFLPPMHGVDEIKITDVPSEPMDKDDTFKLTVEGLSSSKGHGHPLTRMLLQYHLAERSRLSDQE